MEMRGRRRSEDHLFHLPPALASSPKLLPPSNIAPPLAGVAPASLAWASGHFSLLCWSSPAWIRASPSESPEIDSVSCWGAGGTLCSFTVGSALVVFHSLVPDTQSYCLYPVERGQNPC